VVRVRLYVLVGQPLSKELYAIGRTSSELSPDETRPSFDPPCGSHQLPVILEYSEPILGTQLSQFLLVGTLPAGITSKTRATIQLFFFNFQYVQVSYYTVH